MKKFTWEQRGKKDGCSRGFKFRLLEVNPFMEGDEYNAHAKFEVEISGITDEYHTQYLYPTAEPEFGKHTNQFNKYYSLENDVMTNINEYFWNVVEDFIPEIA